MNPLDKIQVTLKSGNEKLIFEDQPLNFSLIDFWRWSASDLLSNATRGRFAEFIVATATNIDFKQIRDEWSAYDLETPEGIKVEVKSAAYLQSWLQRKLSTISFSTKAAFVWDYASSKYEEEKRRSADVYVFCLFHHTDKQTADPLNLNQWEFYVLATSKLNTYTRSQHSITLNSLKQLTSCIDYVNLKEEIIEKYNFKLEI
ncbi:MAG: hypothetical protein EOP42_26645 [Sphingobacteriaceae bacterium]|nr:MAG: hypothetical protein EOP42_26645 [Sphingobacteriaceae bacterium]